MSRNSVVGLLQQLPGNSIDQPLASVASALSASPVAVVNAAGRGSLVLVCEHASRCIPQPFRGLGLAAADRARHIAWDIGALDLALRLSALMDAPLVHATYSRLLLDLNRPVDAPDSIVVRSEGIEVPGNAGLSAAERELRQQLIYNPFHAELDALIDRRIEAGQATAVVSIHSFTPRFHGVDRPWHVGIIAAADRRLANSLLRSLATNSQICIGDNLPYSPQDGVYHSMQRHGERRGLRAAMIELRNDQLDGAGQARWARILYEAITVALVQSADASAAPGARVEYQQTG